MRRVYLFLEDFGHEVVLKTLIQRVADEFNVAVELRPRSVRGGHGKMLGELKQFIRESRLAAEGMPDLLVVARCEL